MNIRENSKDNKIVVLVGNGLGRSFDNEGFATESILKKLASSSNLKPETKKFFASLFQSGFPQNEEELGLLEELSDAIAIMDKLPFRVFLCDHKSNSDNFINEDFKKRFSLYFDELKIEFLKYIKESSKMVAWLEEYGVVEKVILQKVQKRLCSLASLSQLLISSI